MRAVATARAGTAGGKGAHPKAGTVTLSAARAQRLAHVYATKASATRAAKAAAARADRGKCTLEIDLAEGVPQATAEMPVTVRGFKPAIDAVRWVVKTLTHDLTDSAYTGRVEMEMQP